MSAADCWEWNKQAVRNKNLPPLKVFFDATHREWHLSPQNETVAPYEAPHNSTANPDDRYLNKDTVDAIKKLATATAIDRKAITQLTATVTRLTATVERPTKDIATMNKKLVVALQ